MIQLESPLRGEDLQHPPRITHGMVTTPSKNGQRVSSKTESPLTPTSRSFKGTSSDNSETASGDTVPSSIPNEIHENTASISTVKAAKDSGLELDGNFEDAGVQNAETPLVPEKTSTLVCPKSPVPEHLTESPKRSERAMSKLLDEGMVPPLRLVPNIRRHTSPPPSVMARSSSDMVRLRMSLDQGDHPRSQSTQNLPKNLVSRTTFPSYPRANSSIDLRHLRKNSVPDASSTEIMRMRNSILVKRKIQKRRKEFLEDENVYLGNKISEGHENFVMAYNMLTGIRVAVSRCAGVMNKLTDADFQNTKKLTFNMDGSELTPSSKYDFKFKDYCPEVFRELRSLFGIDPADYLISITGKYILSELGSPGKSGSFFYYSRDFRFIIKTIHHAEHKQLRRILKDYHSHVKNNPNTLVSQFYGLHRLKVQGGMKKIHFIVMNNLFPPHRDIHIKYDLKGSTWGRYTRTPKDDKENSDLSDVTLKDLNWLESQDKIQFGPNKRKMFLEQLEADVKLMKKINVMDYSLLLGVHDVKKGNSATLTKLSVFDPKSGTKSELRKTNPRDIDRVVDLPVDVFPGRSKYIFYGHDGGIRSTNENNEPMPQIYYLGIIDCLTNYSLKKKLETFWRSLSHNRSTISAIPANEYGNRFVKFIKDGLSKEKVKST